jgi:predicted helicase
VKDQKPPVHVIGLADLENSQIDWDCYDNTKKIKLKPTKQLRQHQTDAVNAVIDGFKTADRGKLIMAEPAKRLRHLKSPKNTREKAEPFCFLCRLYR